MTLKLRILIEKRIGRMLVKTALAAGYMISIDNGGDEDEITDSTDLKAINAAMRQTDEERIYFRCKGKKTEWVYMVYGNDGYDVVCDYTCGTEFEKTVMEKVNAYADKMCEMFG